MALFESDCRHCGSTEHASEDCPHGIFSTKCRHCGSSEHASDDCPHGTFSSKCRHCGSVNHASDDCPHGTFSSKCRHCGSVDHASDSCPQGLFATPRSKKLDSPRHNEISTAGANNDGGCGELIVKIVVVNLIYLKLKVTQVT